MSLGSSQRPDYPSQVAHIGKSKSATTPMYIPIAHSVGDHTADGAMRRFRRHLTEEEAHKYLDGHWRLRIIK